MLKQGDRGNVSRNCIEAHSSYPSLIAVFDGQWSAVFVKKAIMIWLWRFSSSFQWHAGVVGRWPKCGVH